jgi:hypothetical protein
MDAFDLLFDKHLVTKEKVLDVIGDEWSAICYYLSEAYGTSFEPELRKAYPSPIRYESDGRDDKPSFSLFEARNGICKYIWKDSGINKSGNIFYLVSLLYNFHGEDEVFRKINEDFGGDLYPITTNSNDRKIIPIIKPPESKEPASIWIKSKEFSKEGLEFWAKYGITKEDLIREDIHEVQYFWTKSPKIQKVPYTPPTLCFAYKIGKYYKLYQPFNKEFKFISDYPEHYVEGWLQLEYKQDLLVITKSRKDVVVLRSLGYESVSPKSESTMIKAEQMTHLLKSYKRVLILFDNDGKHNGKLYQEEYKIPLIFIPTESGFKDISDFRAGTSREETIKLLKELTDENQELKVY